MSTSVSGPRGSKTLLALAVAPAALLLARQVAWMWPYVSDDAFISLRYSQRLLEGNGLTWTDGERVEGYSNLLWVLATALLGKLGLDLVTAARVLGIACTLLTFVVLARLLQPRSLAGCALAALPPLLIAASAPIATWTTGGLEGPMALLWLAWGSASLIATLAGSHADTNARPWRAAGLPFALLCWTRPDGPLWAAIPCLAILWSMRPHGLGAALRSVAGFASLPIAAVLLQLAFRVLYYSDLVPNTAHVKVELSHQAIRAGSAYNLNALTVLAGPMLCALLGTMAAPRPVRAIALALFGSLLGWTAYLTLVGGDHFPGFRLWHAALAPCAALAVLGLRRCADHAGKAAAAGLLASGAIGYSFWQTSTDGLSTFARAEHWEWDGKIIGQTLRAAFAEQKPRIAVDAAGAVPYFAELPALDMLGLCDRTIATSPPPAFVQTVLARAGRDMLQGHMRGNGSYVMDQAPDLVLFANPPGLPLAVFASGLDFEGDPRWLQDYRCVVIETGEQPFEPGGVRAMSVPLWIRTTGRAGVERTVDRVAIPAYLLGAYRQPQAFRFSYDPPEPGSPRDLDLQAAWNWFTRDRFVAAVPAQDGTLELELRQDKPASLELTLPIGRYRLQATPAAAPLDFTLSGAGITVERDFITVAGNPATRALLVATPQKGAKLPIRLRSVALQRLDK